MPNSDQLKRNSHKFVARVIKASAGTGKTHQLTSRIIGILAAEEHAERILATTFTRKAAGEIRERIFYRVARAACDSGYARVLSKEIAEPKADQEFFISLLVSLVRSQHRLKIFTLDSFFVQMAQGFTAELGLSPGWRIVDEAGEKKLKRLALQKLLSSVPDEELLPLLRAFNKETHHRSVFDLFEDGFSSLYDVFRKTGPEAWSWLECPDCVDDGTLRESLEALRDAALPTTQQGKADRKWQSARDGILSDAALERWEGIAKSKLVSSADSGGSYNGKPFPEMLRRALLPLATHARAKVLGKLRDQTLAAYHLLTVFDSYLDEAKNRAGVATFADVKYRLAEAQFKERLSGLYYRLDSSISHLLLDEFQDTAVDEWRVLSPLADEILSKANGEASFFCVGDVKQAIYGWRGGESEIFDKLASWWPLLSSCTSTIQETRRCAPAIIDTVNAVFQSLPCNEALKEFGCSASTWAQRFEAHSSTRNEIQGYVSLRSSPEAAEEEHQNEKTLAYAAQVVSEILRKAPGASVGVLVKTNEAVAKMIAFLAKPEIGIAASEEGGVPIASDPGVHAFLSLFRLADHPGDTIARYHVASSPLGSLFDYTDVSSSRAAQEVACIVHSSLMTYGFGRSLSKWAREIAHTCSEGGLRRLLQLVDLGHAFEAHGSTRCRDFVDYVSTTRVEDPSSAQVRVMTIYKSKGLEFDVVVLPDLDKELTSSPLLRKVLIQKDQITREIVRVSSYPNRDERALHPDLEALFQAQREEELKESLCVLYVALTRAVHALYLIVAPERIVANEKATATYAGIVKKALLTGEGTRPAPLLHERGNRRWCSEATRLTEKSAEYPSHVRKNRVTLADSPKSRLRNLIRRTPSSFEGGSFIDIKARAKSVNRDFEKGIAIHGILEQVEWLPDDGEAAIQHLPSHVGGEHDRLLLVQWLTPPPIRRLFSRSHYEQKGFCFVQVLREHPFAVREGNILLSGKFDRLIVGKDQDGEVKAEIIDFKTDYFPPDQQEEKIAYYSPQLDAYRRAAAKLLSLPMQRIEMQLAFLTRGMVASV